jgi:hypothetical protein
MLRTVDSLFRITADHEDLASAGSGTPGLLPVVELRGRVLPNAPSLVILQLPMPKPPTLSMAMAAETKVASVGHYL